MKSLYISRLTAVACCTFGILLSAAEAKPNIQLKISADRADCHYRSGETAALTVMATDTNGVRLTSGKVKVAIDNFGSTALAPTRVYDLAEGNPFKTSAVRTVPGFLRWTFSSDGGFSRVFGVGYDTAWIVPGTPEPDDFDEFWRAAIAEYDRAIPQPPVATFDPEISDAAWDVWRLTIDAPQGRKVYGFVSKPKGATGRLPARVEIAAAGYGGWSQAPSKNGGMITLKMTVYPFEPDVKLGKEADYNAMNEAAKAKWGCPAYSSGGISASREDYFFYPVILANHRAIEWFAKRADVKADNITYIGTSQGGGLGLAAMALSPCIARGAVFVPALTDLLSSNLEGRRSCWPQLVECQKEENKAEATKNAPYFCGVNFARRVHQPIRFTVGFSDTTCSPHAVYAAFNVCPSCDKTIVDGIGMPHQVFYEHYQSGLNWLAR